MDVFISWSGKNSHSVAVILADWLKKVVQTVKPFVSSQDIDKGTRWFNEIGGQLEKTNFGILCITHDNMSEPWILFEAGALSKKLGQASVSPFLINLPVSELKGPLAQFNATKNNKEDIFKLVQTISKKTKENALSDNDLQEIFEHWWPKLEENLNKAKAEAEGSQMEETIRPDRELLEEILQLCRTLVYDTPKGLRFLGGSLLGQGLLGGQDSSLATPTESKAAKLVEIASSLLEEDHKNTKSKKK